MSNKTFPPSPRRTKIARALRNELGMSYESIGNYLGLEKSSVCHLIRHGTTSSMANNLRWSKTRFKINLSQ